MNLYSILFISNAVTLLTKSFRLLLLNAADCIMYLGLGLAMGLMHNSLQSLALQIKVGR